MRSDDFELEIFTPEKADVYVAYQAGGPVPWLIVKLLDQARIRAITDLPDSDSDEQRARRIPAGCSALVAVLPYRPFEACSTVSTIIEAVRAGAESGLPIAILQEEGVRVVLSESANELNLQFGDSSSIPVSRGQVYGPILYSEQTGFSEESNPHFERFLAAALKGDGRIRTYAFFIGRLERDFTQAREAIRIAVETEAGIPCLWSDDGRHRLDVESVRERTRMLIKHAAFVIADLTLGVESPERENPSRAHEIGLTIAYGRKLMLCSQEPRRYPYFSIGDMQMSFWSTEEDLECKVRDWIRTNRDSQVRTILNYGLADAYTGTVPRIKKPSFTFDAGQRYVGPKTKTLTDVRAPIMILSVGAICLALVHLANSYFNLGCGVYWMAYIAVVFGAFVWPHMSGRARGMIGSARLVVQFIVLAVLTLMTLALAATKAP